MKKALVGLLSLSFCAAAALALDFGESVRWNSIAGVVTAPGVDNPVSGIHAGAGCPWSLRTGRARVNLTTGAAFFDVDGLVLNGSNSSGTPGPVTAVEGTLVCNPGATPVILDTTPVALNVHGDAQFAGQINGVPSTCNNPLSLCENCDSCRRRRQVDRPPELSDSLTMRRAKPNFYEPREAPPVRASPFRVPNSWAP